MAKFSNVSWHSCVFNELKMALHELNPLTPSRRQIIVDEDRKRCGRETDLLQSFLTVELHLFNCKNLLSLFTEIVLSIRFKKITYV
jgi:hypothetical protein